MDMDNRADERLNGGSISNGKHQHLQVKAAAAKITSLQQKRRISVASDANNNSVSSTAYV